MNKPVQWKVTSFLVGSSDENSAVSCQAKPFYWPGNISGDPAHGHHRQDNAGKAFRKSVGHVRFEASDMKEHFCQDSFKDFVFYPFFAEDFQFDYFQMG